MRILMVTDTYEPARNGVSMWCSLSVRELVARGHDVEVLTYAHDRREPGGLTMYELPAWFGLDKDFKVAPILSGLPDALRGKCWDVVHIHHPILLGPRGIDLGRERGAKVAFTCHSVYTDYLDEYYWGVGRILTPRLNRSTARFVNRCDMTFAPSTRVVTWLRDIGATTRIEMLEAPADTTRVPSAPREQARAALGLGEQPVALYVGRIADEKRVEELVREFAITLRRVPDAMLALVGRGTKVEAVRRLSARLGLDGHVRLLGPLTGEQLGLWYSAADINVSASRSETGPLTVVEAMACGTPTVSLRAPGFEDRITDGVNGVMAEDAPGALADAMATVFADPALRARLAAQAAAKAPLYTPATNTERLVSMYEDLLA